MRKTFLSYSPPSVGEAEIQGVTEVLKDGNWLTSGPKTKEFEAAFKKRVGAESALALNSCTAGLHLAMVIHDVGPDDEVITTPMTFCATTNMIELAGGKVRLADIDEDTLCIDPKQIEKQITKKTKVILPVHYAGHPCDMAAINSLALAAKLKVVEDAAHALPTKIGDQWIGSSSNLTVFSFYANKNITTGEGGMITGPADQIDNARSLALHGMSKGAWDRFNKGGSWKYDVPRIGFKYNLPDVPSAIGLAQLNRLDELYAKRVAVARIYDEAFKGFKFARPLLVKPGVQTAYHIYAVRLQLEALKIDRDQFFAEMAERNIGCGVHYMPIHMLSHYSKKYGWKPEDFPNAFSVFPRLLSLPMSPRMTASDANDVVEAVNDICKKFAR